MTKGVTLLLKDEPTLTDKSNQEEGRSFKDDEAVCIKILIGRLHNNYLIIYLCVVAYLQQVSLEISLISDSIFLFLVN